MEFQVLGRVGYRLGQDWVWPRGAQRARLLAVLLARAGQVVSYDALTEALWGSAQGQTPGERSRSVARLHLHVHRFRQELDSPERLVADRTGYLLRVNCQELDAARFEGHVRQALAADERDPARGDLARQALEQWADPWEGRAYPDIDVPLVTDEGDRLEQLRRDVTEVFFAAEIRRGRHLDVLGHLKRVAAANPLREPLHAQLMLALHQAGRPAEALAVYQDARTHLVQELGLEPSTALRSMQEFVLSGRSLLPAAAGGSPSAAADRPVPAQLPPTAPLVGRDAEIGQLDRALAEPGTGRALITGLPGVGKTALAVAWVAHHREEFPDGQVFVDLMAYGPTPGPSVDTALDRLIRALGGDPTGLRDTGERITTYRSLLAGRRVAVVIDNARTEEQARPFLAAAPGCVSVITSRDTLTGLVVRENAHHLSLEPLAREHAVALLRSLAAPEGVFGPDSGTADPGTRSWTVAAGDGDELGRLAERCAGLPVALRVAALRARDVGLRGPLDAGLAGEEESVLDLLDVGDPMTSARTVFSWSVDALDPEDLRLFLGLGLNVANTIDVGGLAALTGVDQRTVRRGIERLVRANLAFLDGGWVRQHDLLAAYAAERSSDLADPEREGMLCRLLGYYVERVIAVAAITAARDDQGIFTDLREANEWLDRAAGPIVAVAEVSADFAGEEVLQLSRHLGNALAGRGMFELSARLQSTAVLTAERRGDLVAAAHAMQALAGVNERMGNVDLAGTQWERARELAVASGDSGRLAVLHNNICLPMIQRGRFLRVWGHLSAARRHSRAMGDTDKEATIRGNLGMALTLLERFDRAAALLQELLTEDLQPRTRTSVLRLLASVMMLQGRLREAESLIHEGTELATQMSRYVMRGDFLCMLGQIRFRLGDRGAAGELIQRALEETSSRGEPADVIPVLIALAHLQSEDEPQTALATIEEALARARRLQLPEMEFRALLVFAALCDRTGQGDRALGLRELAGTIRQECGLPAEPPPGVEPW
ncbi:AfsR/SARP family transcriptional regulator [Ornithinimicrobium cavernae]|uniref:AfsR/SARP family transcriptional regulator n=1 Tax=Ornithinimicrobium cavernae TaxID=2666047 RepID=UPI0012B16BC1|nr:BTAD domain-containing putative transcriptional regulator [Ornithinimicrobium cavernae]